MMIGNLITNGGHSGQILDSSWSWDTFVKTAANSGVLPSLHLPTALTPVPDEVAALLGTVHSLNRERNQTALCQVTEITAALNRVGIQPVAIKGLANLLSGIYPDVGTRYMADIDLLVQPQEIPSAVEALKKLRYSVSAVHPVEFNIGHTYPPLTRPDSLEIDLHRTLGLPPCPSFLPALDLIRQAKVHTMDGVTMLLPCPTHLLMHHIMHSQMHDVYRERANPSLRTLCDFYFLHQRFSSIIDWSNFFSYFRKHGQYAILALYLLRVEEVLGIDPPASLPLTPVIQVRQHRRKLLRNQPSLRFVDPTYYWRAGIQPRTRRLLQILGQREGLLYLLQKLSNPVFYRRLKSDFR